MSGQDSVDLPIEILIVEDSPTQLERLGHVLEQHGYKVISAHDGAQALVLLGKSRPAVVVSDIVMPKMTGFELCRRIKADMTTENIPVILLTSLSDPEDVLEGLACGADDFITKPFNQKHLIGHIEQMVVNKDLRKGERARLLTLLISTYESAVLRNTELAQAQDDLQSINEHLEEMVEQKTADLSAEIAERQLVEDALRESEARHRSVVRSANDAIISVDKLGAVKDWNRAAENMFGYSEGEILDRPLVRIIPAHFVDAHQGGKHYVLASTVVRTQIDGKPALRMQMRITEDGKLLTEPGIAVESGKTAQIHVGEEIAGATGRTTFKGVRLDIVLTDSMPVAVSVPKPMPTHANATTGTSKP